MIQHSEIKQLPHKSHYYSAVFRSAVIAFVILAFSLGIGIAGYCYFFKIGFVDGLINVAKTNGAKIFASFYALYSGMAFLTSVAVVFGPIFHRFMHRFHLDVRE